jgi:hypothetical protein
MKISSRRIIIIIIVSAIISAIKVNAQSNNISTTGKWGQQIFISDVNGRAFVNKYADVNGSAYLFPNFKFATILLKDGRAYKNVNARLNLVEHEVNFIASNGEEGYIGKGMVSSIQFNDTTKEGVKEYLFQTGFSPVDNQTVIHFYQVLVSGKTSLLKSINKSIDERVNELSGEKSKEFAVRENLYILTGGAIKRIKKDAGFFLNTMADQKDAINQFINSNKLNFKSEEQLKKLVEFYNTL